jgi:hypothetical protein
MTGNRGSNAFGLIPINVLVSTNGVIPGVNFLQVCQCSLLDETAEISDPSTTVQTSLASGIGTGVRVSVKAYCSDASGETELSSQYLVCERTLSMAAVRYFGGLLRLLHVQFWETENSWRLGSSRRGGHRRNIPCLVDASDVCAVNVLKTVRSLSVILANLNLDGSASAHPQA